jgi:hypothetical protein
VVQGMILNPAWWSVLGEICGLYVSHEISLE